MARGPNHPRLAAPINFASLSAYRPGLSFLKKRRRDDDESSRRSSFSQSGHPSSSIDGDGDRGAAVHHGSDDSVRHAAKRQRIGDSADPGAGDVARNSREISVLSSTSSVPMESGSETWKEKKARKKEKKKLRRQEKERRNTLEISFLSTDDLEPPEADHDDAAEARHSSMLPPSPKKVSSPRKFSSPKTTASPRKTATPKKSSPNKKRAAIVTPKGVVGSSPASKSVGSEPQRSLIDAASRSLAMITSLQGPPSTESARLNSQTPVRSKRRNDVGGRFHLGGRDEDDVERHRREGSASSSDVSQIEAKLPAESSKAVIPPLRATFNSSIWSDPVSGDVGAGGGLNLDDYEEVESDSKSQGDSSESESEATSRGKTINGGAGKSSAHLESGSDMEREREAEPAQDSGSEPESNAEGQEEEGERRRIIKIPAKVVARKSTYSSASESGTESDSDSDTSHIPARLPSPPHKRPREFAQNKPEEQSTKEVMEEDNLDGDNVMAGSGDDMEQQLDEQLTQESLVEDTKQTRERRRLPDRPVASTPPAQTKRKTPVKAAAKAETQLATQDPETRKGRTPRRQAAVAAVAAASAKTAQEDPVSEDAGDDVTGDGEGEGSEIQREETEMEEGFEAKEARGKPEDTAKESPEREEAEDQAAAGETGETGKRSRRKAIAGAAVGAAAATPSNSAKKRKGKSAPTPAQDTPVPTPKIKEPKGQEGEEKVYRYGPLDLEEEQRLVTIVAEFSQEYDLSQQRLGHLLTTPGQDLSREDLWLVNEAWDKVLLHFPLRKTKHIKEIVKRKFDIYKSSRKWTPEDDQRLRELVEQHTADNGRRWLDIGLAMDRYAEACRDRYRNYASCGSNRKTGKWKDADLGELYTALVTFVPRDVQEKMKGTEPPSQLEPFVFAPDWIKISKLMGNTRSRQQCHFKWQHLRVDIQKPHVIYNLCGGESGTSPGLRGCRMQVYSMTNDEVLDIIRGVATYVPREHDGALVAWRSVQNAKFTTMWLVKTLNIVWRRLRLTLVGESSTDLSDVEMAQKMLEAAGDDGAGLDAYWRHRPDTAREEELVLGADRRLKLKSEALPDVEENVKRGRQARSKADKADAAKAKKTGRGKKKAETNGTGSNGTGSNGPKARQPRAKKTALSEEMVVDQDSEGDEED